MKNLSIILTALTASTAPLLPQAAPAPEQGVKPMVQIQKNGQEAIFQIREIYKGGGYDDFLKELDDSYVAIRENGQLSALAETRSGYVPEWQEWEERARALHKERSEELIEMMEGQKNSPFVEKVLSAASNLSDDAQERAIIQITNFRAMAPGDGKNEDENRLIDIDLEYEYKSLHIDLPGSPSENRREKHCALQMEKLDKMTRAASEFKDEDLKKSVALYSENFDARLSQSWDAADLNALVNGKKKPADALEEKVASLLALYQEKFSDLSKQFFDENERS